MEQVVLAVNKNQSRTTGQDDVAIRLQYEVIKKVLKLRRHLGERNIAFTQDVHNLPLQEACQLPSTGFLHTYLILWLSWCAPNETSRVVVRIFTGMTCMAVSVHQGVHH